MDSNPDLEEAVYTSALLLDSPEARSAYLDSACAGKPNLRRQVEELIAAGEAAGTFLAHPVLFSPPTETPATASQDRVNPTGLEALGSYVGRYRLLHLIGQGGCGRVFLAEQAQPVRRQVALKVIKLGMDTQAVVARFEAERQALALMDHPHVAKVLDAGATETGRPFFVMDLVRGIPITRYCDEQKIDLRQRLELFIKVCHAVQHAHQKGLIHRDIKPSNILVVSVDGIPTPKIIDFGIAKATDSRLTNHTVHSDLHQFIGTPAYMSPEQAHIGRMDIDTRSDIYSLGVLLYELLVGSTPFNGQELLASGIESMRKTISEREPQRPSARLTRLPGSLPNETAKMTSSLSIDLDWIVMMCLEKDRERRYPTASDLAIDLNRYLNHEPVAARPPTQLYRFRKLVHRNRTIFYSTVIILFLMTFGTVVSTWYAVRANKAEKAQSYLRIDAQQRELKSREDFTNATRLRKVAESSLEQLRRLVYMSDMNVADHALREGNVGSAEKILQKHIPMSGQPDMRGLEWRYIFGETRGENRQTLEQNRESISCVKYSPEGETLVTSGGDSNIRVWKRNPDGQAGSFFGITNTESSKAFNFSAKAQLLAIRSDLELLVLDSHTYKTLWNLGPISPDESWGLTFSPDGQQLATKLDGGVGVWNMDSKKRMVISGKDKDFGVNLVFCSRKKTLAIANFSTVEIWDTSDFKKMEESEQSSGVITSLSASKTRDILFVGRRDGTITLLSVPQLKSIKKWKAHSSLVYGLAISPDEKTIASGGGDQIIKLWDVSRLMDNGVETQEPKSLRGHSDQIWTLAFSPDGRYLASGSKDGVVNQWDLFLRGITMPAGTSEALKSYSSAQFIPELPTLPYASDVFNSEKTFYAHPHPDGIVLDLIEKKTGNIRWSFKLEHHKRISRIVFSKSDKFLGVGWHDNKIRIFETETGRMVSTMSGHFSAVSALIFSLDERNIISGGTDGVVKIWDLQTGMEMVSVDPRKGVVRGFEFNSERNVINVYCERISNVAHEIKIPLLSEIDSLMSF